MYTPDGKRIRSWGEPGSEPGQFNLPHNIACDADGWVYVADRENHRIQVFDGQGRFETQWHNLHRPSGMYMPPGKCPICYVGEIGPYFEFNRGAPNLGPRISILDHQGRLLGRLDRRPSAGPNRGSSCRLMELAVEFNRGPVCRRSCRGRMAVALPRHAAAKPAAPNAEVRSPGGIAGPHINARVRGRYFAGAQRRAGGRPRLERPSLPKKQLLQFETGRSERIRTSGPCLPKTVLYQAELHSDTLDRPAW